jgi:hypothetical protein
MREYLGKVPHKIAFFLKKSRKRKKTVWQNKKFVLYYRTIYKPT